jgi:FixJ family two-component response regulator
MGSGLSKIYLVDDDASIRRALGRVMASAGFEHEAFASAEDFLATADAAGAACVVADTRLPGMSGLDLIRRAASTFPGLPFILVTANDEEETRREARSAGAAAFFRKPVDAEALLDTIRWAIRPPVPERIPAG